MTSITLFGASGRMGRAIAEVAADRDDIAIVEDDAELFIDFSAPAGLRDHLDTAIAAKRPILIGTTGLGAEHHGMIDAAARQIAVLQAANTSLGISLLAHLVRETAARLHEEWDIEIVEMHHRHKRDAPSGTALLLGEAAAGGRRSELGKLKRDDNRGARAGGTIGFASLRGGSVTGDHMVVFAGEDERIELGHRAESRAIFAEGAVKAGLWLVGKPPGRYAMADMLGLT